jgi:folate-binding protein YgfZ
MTNDERRTRATSDERRTTATSDERGGVAANAGPQSAAYLAARHRVAFRRRRERGTIRATGKDRLDWLQGLVTNDVKSFDGSGWRYAAWLTPQGRMITDLGVIETGEETWLDVPASLSGSLAQKLDLLIFTEDVKIEDTSDRLVSVAVHGPEAAKSVDALLGHHSATLARGGLAVLRDGTDRIAIARSRLGPDALVLYLPSTRAAGLEEALAHGGAVPLDDEAAEALRIEAGVPRFLVDMTEETIPLEVGLDHAISHTKGCYVGQEIIVRIRDLAKGRVARHLVGVLPEGRIVPAAGTPVVAGERTVGRITSAVWSPALDRPIALAIIHRDAAALETSVALADGTHATITALPFVAEGA